MCYIKQEYLGSVSFNLARPPGSAPLLKWYTISCDSKFAQTSDRVTGRLLLEIQTYTRASFKGLPPPWELDDDDAEVPQVALSQIFWWYKGIVHITVAAGFHMPKMVIMSSLVKSLENDQFCLKLLSMLFTPSFGDKSWRSIQLHSFVLHHDDSTQQSC